MYRIIHFTDLFVDACVRDEAGNLLFMSLFGRDGVIRQFMAAFQLSQDLGGIRDFSLRDEKTGDIHKCLVGDAKNLTQISGRLPKDNLFGNVVHTFIYAKGIEKPNKGTRTAWILKPYGDMEPHNVKKEHLDPKIWDLYKLLSPVPLLDHWKDEVLKHTSQDCVVNTMDTNYPAIGNFAAVKVNIPENFTERISLLVKANRIALADDHLTRSIAA